MVENEKGKDDGKLKTGTFVVDFFSKVLLGVAAAYFTYATYVNSVEAECTKNVSHLFDFVFGKDISAENINSAVSVLVKTHCEGFKTASERTRLVETLSGLSPTTKAVSSSPSPALPPSALPSNPGNPDGNWVAVGFVGTPDYNFTKPDGGALGEVAEGATIKAKWQVNVRRKPADWRGALKVLEAGDCFTVSATQTLTAAGQKQLWANGTPKKCS
ncbi:hypothetical protein PMI42_06812 [Bradyrhizobium sp. YR681]|uniref:hypothetical protein n=1 Tax=Bradyrhizobium sp. YR681 TaxID=1144344 RepID=UPI00026F862E|nr:hypothetical protein [Bradyrhizobium sp. YR681]EJN09491.1 hypothetical protein PMI42_06812 [Bradyrhizobium sp. YR681]